MLETGLRRSGLDERFEVVYAGEDGAEQRLPFKEVPQVVEGSWCWDSAATEAAPNAAAQETSRPSQPQPRPPLDRTGDRRSYRHPWSETHEHRLVIQNDGSRNREQVEPTLASKATADQVAVQFGMSDEEMTGLEPQIGNLVKDAESTGAVAYSYTFSDDVWGGDLGDYAAVAFVNQRWLDLMTTDAPPNALKPVPYDRVKDMVTREFSETFTLLSRSQGPGAEILSGFDYRRPADGFRLPVGEGGGGSLQFLDDVLVAVVPSLQQTFNDRNLTSMVSTRNLLFTGVAATQTLLERNGLSAGVLSERGIKGELTVVYVAEEGIHEPTASLDAANRRKVIDLFTEFAANGRTVIVSTHDSEMIEACGSRHEIDSSRTVAQPVDQQAH